MKDILLCQMSSCLDVQLVLRRCQPFFSMYRRVLAMIE